MEKREKKLWFILMASISFTLLSLYILYFPSFKVEPVINSISYEMLTESPGENWITYSGDYKGHRFSPLMEIRPANLDTLAPKWVYKIHGSQNLRTTPLVSDGTMYVSNVNRVYALNAETGGMIWLSIWLDEKSKDKSASELLNSAVGINRGVALLGDRVFFVTEDCTLVALDRKTGRQAWSKNYADNDKGYYATLAPLALNNKIVVGVSGGDNGVRGFISAFKPDDGEELWRFWTVPAKGEPGAETWGKNFNLDRGGAMPWLNGSYDPELNTIYWATGNPWPPFNNKVRPGDNLYSNSMLALDADSGKLKWYSQFTPNDAHAWDSVGIPVLVDRNWNGQLRKLLLFANRNGFFYVLDRTNGEFLLGKPFVKTTWAKNLDGKGRPILSAYKGFSCPSLPGATNWWSPSYNSLTGLFYVNALEQCEGELGSYSLLAIDPQTGNISWKNDLGWANAMAVGIMSTARRLVFTGNKEGRLLALDGITGKKLWQSHVGPVMFASPMSYAIKGKQYIAIAAGSEIISFKLNP